MVLVLVSLLVANVAVLLFNMNCWLILASLLGLIGYIVYNYWSVMKIFYNTLPRDIRAGIKLLRAKWFLRECKKHNKSVPKVFKELAQRHPNRVMFYFKDEVWTFGKVDEMSNRVANVFAEMGYHPGEEVALMMNTRPEFVVMWLGLAKAGLITAFINTNQRLEALTHSITVVNCKAVIYEPQLAKAIHEILPSLQDKSPSMRFFSFGEPVSQEGREIPSQPLHDLLDQASSDDPVTLAKGNFSDKLYYIFTSGTTGLPKAAVIRNHRYIWMGSIIRSLFSFDHSDNLYLTLPLYHNNAGTMGSAQGVLFGITLTLREKFSASNFWEDCIRYKCTGAMYIGEICRYLLAQPEKPVDKQHNVRILFGNGLRQKIWTDVKTRFNIKQIGEFYGATEGNANVANISNKEGACGFVPCCIQWLCRLIYPVVVIKVDEHTGEALRDANGLCIPVKPGEIGEIVGKIHESDPSRAYPGYHNPEATKKKVVHNVLVHGDKAFLSGDLMEMDELGFLYFRDRTGDTFRWKGENVSTTEIEAIIQKVIKLNDCVVFGVSVEQCEGKACMLVMTRPQTGKLDVAQLYHRLKDDLPSYAVPLFVRVVDKIEITGSYKLQKHSLEKEGFNPNVVKDELYFLDKKSANYVPLTTQLYQQIQSGNITL
ncbi:long-chain fatty acid transport protein 4-like [Oppia nitens]|uniref:long-chain fatty acid transport protein 4-like n=1 Tax=Oppia nitens TaxID=1686743 RepID=UPI0023DB1FDB|nr:long-chain fatty acid transport protein 4-like [Oppia nitens]